MEIESVDGNAGRLQSSSALFPFDLIDGTVRWGETIRLGSGEGWIPRALGITVRKRHKFRTPPDEIRKQAERCVLLGHLVALSPTVADRLQCTSWAPAGGPDPSRS